jgi:hypothetical protein
MNAPFGEKKGQPRKLGQQIAVLLLKIKPASRLPCRQLST